MELHLDSSDAHCLCAYYNCMSVCVLHPKDEERHSGRQTLNAALSNYWQVQCAAFWVLFQHDFIQRKKWFVKKKYLSRKGFFQYIIWYLLSSVFFLVSCYQSHHSCSSRVFIREPSGDETPLTCSGYAAAAVERLRFNWLHTSGLSALWDDKGHRWEWRSRVHWFASDPVHSL